MVAGLLILVACSTPDEATSDTEADVPAAATQQVTCNEYLTTYKDVGIGLEISLHVMAQLLTDWNADFITAEEAEPQLLTMADEFREMAGSLEVLVVPEPLVEHHPERMAVVLRTFANVFYIAAELVRGGSTSEEDLFEMMDAAVKQSESVGGRIASILRACDF